MIAAGVTFAVPKWDPAVVIGRICPIAVAALVLFGCTTPAAMTSRCPACAGADAGAGFHGSTDAGPSDHVPRTDGGSSFDASAPTPGLGEDEFGPSACFDGLDDDGNGSVDCRDTTCSGAPYCCLGAARPECCADPSEPEHVDFGGCDGTDPTTCGAGLSAFGSPLPILEGGAFVPNGGEGSDAGLVLGTPLHADRDRVTVSATIAASVGACTDCLDGIGVGIGDPVSGSSVSVHADVAVFVRPARGDVALLVAGSIVRTLALPDSEAHLYALTAAPDGSVTLAIDGTEAAHATWAARPDRRALLWGRTRNRPAGAPPPARATDIVTSVSSCEVPSALGRDGTSILPPEGSTLDVHAPSAAAHAGEARIAFEADGDIYLARPDGSGGWAFAGAPNTPALMAPAGEAYRDPELVEGGDRWVLYLTHEAGGERRIARADGVTGFEDRFADPVDLSAPSDAGSIWAPSVTLFGGATLIAAVTRVDDQPRIVLLDELEGALSWHGGTLEASTVVTPRGDLFAFDADEVGGPVLHVDGAGLLRLYYAGRRGARWSIGLVASGDGHVFSDPPAHPVLSPSAAGFDALSVSAPSVLRQAGALDLVYEGSDGVYHRIGLARGGTRW